MKEQFIVGKFYLVPCMHAQPSARSAWMDASGWVPVLGPKHEDAEHLDFEFPHYHIDWRFVGHAAYRIATNGKHPSPLRHVMTNNAGNAWHHKLEGVPQLRRIKCKREMPEFPHTVSFNKEHTNWERMERAQAFTCNKLKPGNICPHRGIDLTSFIKDDGTVICPGHGLKWNTVTGELMPRHGGPI